MSDAPGLGEAVARRQPRLVLFGHHQRVDAEVAGIRCIGLKKGGMPGNLVALRLEEGRRDSEVLGEWPLDEELPGPPKHRASRR